MKREDFKYITLAELQGWTVLQNGREFKNQEDLTGLNLSFEKTINKEKIILRKRHGFWNRCISIDGQIVTSNRANDPLSKLLSS